MDYPVTLSVEYPPRLSRLTTFFRFFMVIPQAFVFAFVTIAAWFIMFLAWWAILFTARYPETFFKFIAWWWRRASRFTGYIYLLTDKYPPFSGREDTEYPVIFRVEAPGTLSRLTTFFRFPVLPTPNYAFGKGWSWQWQPSAGMPMILPHAVILYFISIASGVILFLAWWAILFTGRYPRAFFDFVTWYFRWETRMGAYSYLVTDKYPPFTGRE
ncbi:DUF4389 domain-containing protein [Chloroflexota bacterium]